MFSSARNPRNNYNLLSFLPYGATQSFIIIFSLWRPEFNPGRLLVGVAVDRPALSQCFLRVPWVFPPLVIIQPLLCTHSPVAAPWPDSRVSHIRAGYGGREFHFEAEFLEWGVESSWDIWQLGYSVMSAPQAGFHAAITGSMGTSLIP
jgi:hypothetical protein